MRVRTAQPDLLNSSGKIICDNFTSKSRSGKNEFVKLKETASVFRRLL